MNDEKHGFAPSNSTTASALGGAVAVIVIAVCAQFGIYFEAGVEAAIAVIAAAGLGYLPKSGRRPKPEESSDA
jgi:uncharacterized membrane protein